MKPIFLSLLLFFFYACSNNQRIPQMGTLKQKLEAKKADYANKWSAETLKLHENGIAVVDATNITQQALQVGDQAVNFALQNHLNKTVDLYETLKNGPVVLTWYRGGWCPYCNLTLRALQQALPEIKAEGATLLALTPEVPDQSLSTTEKNDLNFEVGKQFGVVFQLEKNVAAAYQEAFDLHQYNGDESDELPLAATYIIGQDGTIQWAFLDADYRNRAEPADIIEALKKLP